MNRRELFKQLNSLCNDLDYLYDINNGGCCYVAAVIAEQLELHHIPFTVIHYNVNGCHYAIRVRDRIINRSDYRCKEIVSDEIISSDDLYDIYNDGGWNLRYETKYNSIVKRKIKSLFNKYENRRT